MGCLKGALVLVTFVIVVVVLLWAAQYYSLGSWQVLISTENIARVNSSSMHPVMTSSTLIPAKHEMSELHNLHDKVFMTHLIHRDHPDSPVSSTYDTSSHSERVAAMVKRSLGHHDYLSRQLLSSNTSGVFVSQVMPDISLWEYTIALSVGTPPQQLAVAIVTSVDLTWLNCQPCIQCITPAHGPPFNPSLSSSYFNVTCADNFCQELIQDMFTDQNSCSASGTCQYDVQYTNGGESSGDLAYDTVTVTDLNGLPMAITKVVFGCGHDQSMGFNGTDGLLGLGQGILSLPSQFENIYADIFSYCLVPFHLSTTNVSSFYFGSLEGLSITSNLVYTSIIPNNFSSHTATFYYVAMMGISVNGTMLNIPNGTFDINPANGSGGVIFSSSNPLTLLNPVAYTALTEALVSVVTYQIVNGSLSGFDLFCVNATGVSNPLAPTIAFQFLEANSSATINFVLAPEYFMLPMEPNIYCLAISVFPTDYSWPSMIGTIAQANYQVVYDRVHGQIGWASTTC